MSYYDNVREINFPSFIAYFPSDGSKVEEEEFQKLREVEAWGFDNCETLEDMVVYRALYGDGDVWVRPASMWNESVILEGKQVKRFELIETK